MSDQRPPDEPLGSEAALEHELSDALTTRPWDTAMQERVRAAVEDEWRATTAATRNGSRRFLARPWYGALAVGLTLVAVAIIANFPLDDGPALGQLARVLDGRVEVRSWWPGHRALTVGDPVRVGSQVTAHGLALIALAKGGTLRIAPGSVVDIPEATRIALKHGLIYVDCPPNPASCGPLRVTTLAGVIEHVGTEFEVLGTEHAVRIRVREGRIRFTGRTASFLAEAGTEVLALSGGQISRQPVATFGRDWLWTAALAPDYQIEGRPLIEFLHWASRELGRPLSFADAHALQVANQTILHGSVNGVDPLEALAQVLTTTSLGYEIAGGTIRVHSNP